jgi:hypothetical protein
MINHFRPGLNTWSRMTRLIYAVPAVTLIALALVSCGSTSTAEITEMSVPGSEVPRTSVPPKNTPFPPGFPTPDPEKYQECLDQGGRWEVLGFSGPGCNLPTTDGGQPCRNSDECESACLAADEEVMRPNGNGGFINHQRIDELNAQGGDLQGACSPWRENFGCRVWVENGRYAAICVD